MITDIKPLDIGILCGKRWDPLSWPIKWRSLSDYTHCVIFSDRDGSILDPTIGGILPRHIDHYRGRELLLIRYIARPLDEKRLMAWLLEKKLTCKGYDYLAWLGFATGLKELQDEDRWFCSELPYWMLQENGYRVTNEDITFIYPSDLARNPLFEMVWRGDCSGR